VDANANGKALFCAFGGVGIMSPGESEREFAVAVVEIDSPGETTNVAFSDFILFDKEGRETKFNRLISVEVFDRAHQPTEGSFAYYLNSGGTQPWKGTLPAGKIRLRIKVALPCEPGDFPGRFRLIIGKNSIEGPVDGEWPTG
jgi:hypothetical protein